MDYQPLLRKEFDYDRENKTHHPHCGRRPALRGTGGGDRQPPCGGTHAHRPRHPGRYTRHERSGCETIQGTPTKPDAPEHPGKTEKDHAADDVPDADRNKETPPTYKPEQTEVKPQPTEPAGGSTNDAGQVYVPGFGYITPSGPNDGGTLNDMYENGNKIGIMGG